MVNGAQQTGGSTGGATKGDPKHFATTYSAPKIGVTQYRRTSAMIRINDTDSYVVDLFRVKGGDKHEFSFHTGEANAPSVTGLDLVSKTGSYLSADIPSIAEPVSYTHLDGRLLQRIPTWRNGTMIRIPVS